jgi:hypothetical protein
MEKPAKACGPGKEISESPNRPGAQELLSWLHWKIQKIIGNSANPGV